jgi:hypothetical protein
MKDGKLPNSIGGVKLSNATAGLQEAIKDGKLPNSIGGVKLSHATAALPSSMKSILKM